MKRNVIFVDGFQAMIVSYFGVLPFHHIRQIKKQWANEFGVGYDGVGFRYVIPEEGLKEWKPKRS